MKKEGLFKWARDAAPRLLLKDFHIPEPATSSLTPSVTNDVGVVSDS